MNENKNESNEIITFILDNGKEYKVNSKIKNMCNINFPNIKKFNIHISEFNLEQFLKYCEGHNFIPYKKEIKRPLNDNLRFNIENDFDYDFILNFDFEKIILFINETFQFNCASLIDLCLTRLALIIRNLSIDELIKIFHVNKSEFNENIINKILKDNESLMIMDDERVKELLNDDL
jgi:hypothetical protein